MSDHIGAVFSNSCRTVPRNPQSSQPSPYYEQKYLNELCNEATKLNMRTNDDESPNKAKRNDPIKSFIEFFDSIPEYDDVNHLSNKDFYRKVQSMREKQRTYSDFVEAKIKCESNSDWLREYENITKRSNVKNNPMKKARKPNIKIFCATPTPESDRDIVFTNPPSRRSVRIETPSDRSSPQDEDLIFKRPKSRLNLSSAGSLKGSAGLDNVWEEDFLSQNEFNLDDELNNLTTTPKLSKSAPNSPRFKSKSNNQESDGITIPKPFEMTVRDEEEKIVDELMKKSKKPQDIPKFDLFKAHPVPIESQIPLFDKIMADQELKNHIIRERSKANLISQMKPFSFTRRDEEIQKLTKGLSKSSPSLFLDDPAPIKVKKFKAKPIPKNLFSNYIYQKMYEDEFYRALRKKIRAEEMLKAASLPPSMAKREKLGLKYEVCPRIFRSKSLTPENEEINKRSKSSSSLCMGRHNHDDFSMDREFEDLKNEFLYDFRPTKSSRSKKSRKGKNKKLRNSSATTTSSSDNSHTISCSELHAVSRSNLAAVLRIQSARRRLELEMCRKLEEIKLREEARWREKIMRKKPVWQTLRYSHEEDLAMRLQLRRDEEKLRNEEHRLRMELMLGRVNQQPTLFERQSQVKFPRSREELIETLYGETESPRGKPSRHKNSTKLMKDEEIQAILDEIDDVDEDKPKSDSTT